MFPKREQAELSRMDAALRRAFPDKEKRLRYIARLINAL
jgi:endonuclease V-like protein UPF0215 family